MSDEQDRLARETWAKEFRWRDPWDALPEMTRDNYRRFAAAVAAEVRKEGEALADRLDRALGDPTLTGNAVVLEVYRALDAYRVRTEGNDLVAAIARLPMTTSEEMQDQGFPFNVSDDLTEAEARDLERITTKGPPDWVRRRVRTEGDNGA